MPKFKGPNMWLILFRDPATKAVHGSAYTHNATGDYKNNPYYIGTVPLVVDIPKEGKKNA